MKKVVVLFLSLMLLLCACTSQTDNNSQAQSSDASEGSVNQISIPDVSDANMSDISSTMPEDDTSNEDNTSNTMSEDDTSGEDSSSSTSEHDEENTTIIVTYLDKDRELPDEYRAFLEDLLSSDGWIEDTAECVNNFTIRIGDKTFYYHSECGTINIKGEERSKSLTESEQTELNGIFSVMFESYKETLSESNKTVEDDTTSASTPNNEEAYAISITYNDNSFTLMGSYNEYVRTQITSGNWADATPDCAYDFIINIGEKTYYYHSECGTVIFDGKSKKLSDSDKSNLNNMLFVFAEAAQNN